ncbi:MAG: DUF6493 family protein [Micrococcales bacterium]|nr:DUF6493 family protein [Micrococcales bacterium]MCL2667754.1 DUF6493 family protein [Micrococcales bacterium]
MPKNPHLDEAVSIFTELGWADATHDDVPTLPLGTPAQRKAALAGLRSGDWVVDGVEHVRGRPVFRDLTGVDNSMLALFAIRLGVGLSRTVALLDKVRTSDVHPKAGASGAVFAEVVGQRGPVFTEKLVERMARSERLVWQHGRALVYLVAAHQLPVPTHLPYLTAWIDVAGRVLSDDPWDDADDRSRWPITDSGLDGVKPAVPAAAPDSVVAGRFADHVQAALTVDVRASQVLAKGAARGLLERAEAVELALVGMDAATRPSTRKAWMGVWLDALAATDEEVVGRADVLVPVLATGDSTAVARLGPVLVTGVDDDMLADVVTAALCGPTTKKARRAVLEALAARPRPSTADVIEPQVTQLATDQSLAKAVTAVVERWGLTASTPDVVQGWWRPPPPVWQLPRFDRGEVSVDAFVALNAELFRRASATWSGGVRQAVDVAVEQFLALANELSRRGQGARLRSALAGGAATSGAVSWSHGRVSEKRNAYLLEARDQAVFAHLGKVPCLLSEPSWVDLRIDPADLLTRLHQYAQEGAKVVHADLFLALARADVSTVDPGLLAALDEVHVPVVLWDGKVAPTAAGPAVRRYLVDPYRDPGVELAADGRWTSGRRARPASLDELGARLGYGLDNGAWLSVFPGWGDSVWGVVRAGADDDIGVVLRQAVRRADPLPPGAAVNLLAVQRSPHPAAASDVGAALVEAWERGLLRPGVPDARYLDWTTAPKTFAATARTLGELAAEGLLAAVWPVLDDMLVLAASAARMPAGTAEVVQTVHTLLPEVLAAVTSAVASPDALDLPGIRAIAGRPGSSQAVTTARQVVAQLPDQTTMVTVNAPVDAAPLPPFDEVWPSGLGGGAAVQSTEGLTVVDGFAVRYYWEHPRLGPGAPVASALVATALIGLLERPQEWTKFWEAVARGRISAATVQVAVRTVVDAGVPTPARLARLLEHNPQALPVLWPVLTEPVRVASVADPLPRWLNGVLDVAVHHAPTLREAARRGLLPSDAWSTLPDLASRAGKSVALTKARVLLAALGLEPS